MYAPQWNLMKVRLIEKFRNTAFRRLVNFVIVTITKWISIFWAFYSKHVKTKSPRSVLKMLAPENNGVCIHDGKCCWIVWSAAIVSDQFENFLFFFAQKLALINLPMHIKTIWWVLLYVMWVFEISGAWTRENWEASFSQCVPRSIALFCRPQHDKLKTRLSGFRTSWISISSLVPTSRLEIVCWRLRVWLAFNRGSRRVPCWLRQCRVSRSKPASGAFQRNFATRTTTR
jgi:hypothetical protein